MSSLHTLRLLALSALLLLGATQQQRLLLLSSSIPGCPVGSQPTNLLVAPNAFTNGAWTASALTVNPAAASDPCSGGTDASQFLDTAASSAHEIFQSATVSGSGATATAAVFLKQSTGRFAVLSISQNSGSFAYAVVDTQQGTITQHGTDGTFGTYTSSSIAAAGSGWYYVTLTGSVPTTTYFWAIAISSSGTPGTATPSYVGTVTGVFVYQGRLSNGAL